MATGIDEARVDQAHQREITVRGNPGNPVGEAGTQMLERMNASHADVTDWGLSHFEVAPDAHLLDVGCGGGATILRLLRLCPEGHVSGIDHSEVSVATSAATCAEAIAAGRVDVCLASVEAMPFADDTFQGVCTVECFYFWGDHLAGLKEVLRVLAPGSALLVISDLYDDGALTAEDLANIEQFHLFVPTVEEMQQLMSTAGFVDVCVHTLEGTRWMCAEGHKPLA